MISEKLQKALNDQIKHELYSAYLYLSMSSHFSSANLPGFAHWMLLQSDEEREHAMKFYDYLLDRGCPVTLQGIDQPPAEFGKPLDIFKQSLQHEQKVTALINNLYSQALQDNDFPTQIMLQWFVSEQVEEEKNATEIVELLKMVGDHPASLLMIDRKMGERAGE
jgi:ferritin